MSPFIDFLTLYIRNELASALTAAPGQELRVFFAGPPKNALAEIFESLLAGNEALVVNGQSIPVFILDGEAADPDRLCSARCTASHLVKVRTSGCRVFLALISTDELTNVSIDTTVTWIGMRNPAKDVQDWLGNSIMHKLVNESLNRFFRGESTDKAMNIVAYSLEEAWELDEPFKDHRNTWLVVRRLFDCLVQTGEKKESFLAILGLPKCDSDDFGTVEHLKVLARIADLVENSGFIPGFTMLEDQADEELRPYIKQFRQHVLTSCIIPADFSAATAKHYTPISGFSPTEIPGWWGALTLNVWNRLLDSPSETIIQRGLSVSFLNAITPLVRGLPTVLLNHVCIQVTIPDSDVPANLEIRRASGAKQLEQLGTINVISGSPTTWDDSAIPAHDRYVRYELHASGYKRGTLKCIVLDQYAPGVALYARNATKITPFKLNRKARDSQGLKIERYECDMALHGMGSHQLDFYKGTGVILGTKIIGYEVTSEQSGVLERLINGADEHHSVCIIDTDEECYYDFMATPIGAELPITYRIWITTEDKAPTGAASEFDRLILEHRASANGENVNARVEPATSRLTDFQIWAIETKDSFYPVVLGAVSGRSEPAT